MNMARTEWGCKTRKEAAEAARNPKLAYTTIEPWEELGDMPDLERRFA